MFGESEYLQRERVEVNPLDIQANERTYLAWTRTGLTVITIGITFHVFSVDLKLADIPVFSPLLILFGVITLVYASWRFHRRERQLQVGLFGADRAGPLGLGMIIILMALSGAFILLI